jgi:hypothetical protein
LTSPLANALCTHATRTAQEFFRICVRSIDYLPPFDVTFGDFLRALMTAQADYDPEDTDSNSDALMQSFRRREILPDDAAFFSMDGLVWATEPEPRLSVNAIPLGGPLGYCGKEKEQTAQLLREFVRTNMDLLGLEKDVPYDIPSFHPVYRTDDVKGSVRWDLVVEIVQKCPDEGGFPIRGGTTLIISTHGTRGSGPAGVKFVRYIIRKPRHGSEAQRERCGNALI